MLITYWLTLSNLFTLQRFQGSKLIFKKSKLIIITRIYILMLIIYILTLIFTDNIFSDLISDSFGGLCKLQTCFIYILCLEL